MNESPQREGEDQPPQARRYGGSRLRTPRSRFGDKPKNFTYRDLKLLLPFVKPHWRLGSIAGLIALASTLVSLLIPLSFKYLADDAVLAGNHGLLNTIILILVGAFSLIALTDFFKQIYFFRFQQEVVFSIQGRLFNKLLCLPKSFFDSNATGYLMSRVAGDVFQLQAFFSINLVDIIAKSLQLILAVVILLYLNWRLTLLSFAVLPLFVITARLLTKKTRRASRAALEKTALVSEELEERLSGAALIKAFAAEHREAQKILDTLRNAFHANRKRITITSFFALVSGLINALGLGCVLWYGASLIIEKQLTAGELLAFSVYLGFLIEPAKFLANLNIALQHSFAALERVFEIMNLVPEYEGEAGRVKASKINGGVRFDNVSFSYDKQRPALEGVSFESTTGQLIAIVGPSGAGKSTLVNLMMSLYEPCSGQIYFDGIPASHFTPQSLRERIGIVSQEIFLFNDTVKNNIRYGRTGASDEEVISAARSAGAHEFISQLPEGYQTSIGERGVMLSVGEKQRLSIARAILKDPDILILDEATSALDAATEQTVRDMLERYRRGKTVFAIAHRLSTVALSDFILVLDKGRIVQSGTHERLRNQEGLYRQLCQTQLLSLDQPAIEGQKSQNAGRILRG